MINSQAPAGRALPQEITEYRGRRPLQAPRT
jgi:hypothetical protein